MIRSLFRTLLLAVLPFAAPTALAQTPDPHVEKVRRVLSSVPLIDGHNDLAWEIRQKTGGDLNRYDIRQQTPGHTDLERLRAGGVGGQFWSVYVPGEYADSGFARVQLEQISLARRIVEGHPDAFAWALSSSDVHRVYGSGRIASVLGMEGGHVIENSLGVLRAYYELGARYMTLTHNVTTEWADAALDTSAHGGLSPFGDEVIREMNRLGMLVDLSHVSPATMSDALDVSAAPVIFSHSGARALADHPRNVPDSILQRLPLNGGVVMAVFAPPFLTPEGARRSLAERAETARLNRTFGPDTSRVNPALRSWQAENPLQEATLSDAADHIEHIRRVAGIDHVGLGGDFDGISHVPVGLEDVSTYPALLMELSRRGWTEEELRKVAGENILRVWREAEVVSARLRRTEPMR